MNIKYNIKMNHSNHMLEELFARADIHFNGNNPWDIQVHNTQFFNRIIKQGSLGLGESYMDGWWDCEALDELFFRIFRHDLEQHVIQDKRFLYVILQLKIRSFFSKLFNFQSLKRAYQVGQKHYDIGNDLFQVMLDPRMTYSCGYWKNCSNLNQAQENKLKLICDKLGLKAGMEVLDIGCGWGSFAKYAAENYGVSVTGITISKQQLALCEKTCANLPIKIQLLDYRLLKGSYDRVCSIGMFEHVGYKNYHEYMKIIHQCLNDDGLFLLHTIGNSVSTTCGNPWIDQYIFPNGMCPSIKQIGESIETLFVMEDWHNFSADYDKTLLAWHKNFNDHWIKLNNQYSERFKRMWNYYLLSTAASFRSRYMQLWQVVLSKNGVLGGYQSLR